LRQKVDKTTDVGRSIIASILLIFGRNRLRIDCAIILRAAVACHILTGVCDFCWRHWYSFKTRASFSSTSRRHEALARPWRLISYY